jgi:SAM-dependent methyltransferase
MHVRSDGENVVLVESPESVDSVNREFYSRFPYPRPPMTFPRLSDPDFETVMLNQSIGDFSHRTIPTAARVWVAGCGTNQAVYTALKFPGATVLGSDLSPASLDMARRNAAALGITNLNLRQESLNHVTYEDEFDYILCTGVIHHNADPALPLSNIARALRRRGVLELMVYNRYHRIFNTAFQNAVRMLTRHDGRAWSCEEELEVATAMAATEPIASSAYMVPFRNSHESHLADALIQPLEYSYTAESLAELTAKCGLSLMLPCYDQFDRVAGRVWTLGFSSALQRKIDALPDAVRWQITNLLLLEKSPMLWFYVRHGDGSDDGRFEMRVNEDFLERRFVRASTTLRNHVRGADLEYRLAPSAVSYPQALEPGLIRDVVERCDGRRRMRDILPDLGVDMASQKAVTDIRTHTTTALSPYLRTV